MFFLKRNSLTFALFLSPLILFGCGSNDNTVSGSEPVTPPPVETPSVVQFPDGVWVQKGFGRALNVMGETVEQFDYTRETCLKTNSMTQEDLATILEIETVTSDELVATEDRGLLVFSKRDAMPPACSDDRLITENGPVVTLEHFINNFNDYYPFFEVRGVTDWEERVEIARAQVNNQTTNEELADTLITLMSGLDDGHVRLSAGEDFEFTPASPDGKILDVLDSGFENQSEITDFGEYVNAQFQRITEIRNSYFDIDSLEMAGGENQDNFQWATIGNGLVGYIEILNMGGISESPEENDADASEALMDRILTDLAHTEALIINVMVNGGGDLAVADAIASRFSTEKVRVSSYETISYDDSDTPLRTPLVHRDLLPTERVSYSRPVATISGPNTFSAAEHFLLSMRALNHPVCLIGEPSDGILSAVLDKQLPTEGVRLDLSNMIFYDHTGQAFESIGVPVDIESATFAVVDSDSERYEAIDTAMTALGFGNLVNSDTPAADCAFMDARTRFESGAP